MKTATQQAEFNRGDNKLSSVVVAAAQRSGNDILVELHALVAVAVEGEILLPRLQEDFTDPPRGHHLHVAGAALIHIAA